MKPIPTMIMLRHVTAIATANTIMKIRSLPACAALFLAFCGSAKSEAPEEIFDRKLAGNFEPAAVLEGSTSPDGCIAVLFTARKKGLKPANWPSIIPGVPVSSTEVQGSEEDYTTENWIVSLNEKKRLGVVRSKQEDFRPYHGGMNNRSFSALWGPEQEGCYYGVLNYTGRWGCSDIFFVNHEGTTAWLTSIRSLLDSAVRKFMTTQKMKMPEGMQIGYETLDVLNPELSVVTGDTIKVRLNFSAAVPKSDDSVEGTMIVQLGRGSPEKEGARVLSVKLGASVANKQLQAPPAQVPSSPAPAAAPSATFSSAADFAKFRKEWNAQSDSGAWKTVLKVLPNRDKGHQTYVKGWVQGTGLRMLMHVDSHTDKDKSITFYYWREGLLTSAFQLRTGNHTQNATQKATETYDFVNQKLIHWTRTGDTNATLGSGDPGVPTTGDKVLDDSIKFAAPIYTAIGAD